MLSIDIGKIEKRIFGKMDRFCGTHPGLKKLNQKNIEHYLVSKEHKEIKYFSINQKEDKIYYYSNNIIN